MYPSNNILPYHVSIKPNKICYVFLFSLWYSSTCTIQSWTNSEFIINSSAIFIGFYVNTGTWPCLMTLTTSGITFTPILPSRPWDICNMHTQWTEWNLKKSWSRKSQSVIKLHVIFFQFKVKKLACHHDWMQLPES